MKIVVIGGSGLIGKKTVAILQEQGHDVLAASTKTGVNAVTGAGLDEALKGADVVIDVLNSPSWEDDAVMEFFKKSTTNLLKAEAETGVKHHVALSVVGTARLQQSGYFRAKQVQEDLIKGSNRPYTIIQATQFYEFIGAIADFSADGEGKVHLSTCLMQPMASEDVASVVAEVAVGKPMNTTIEVGGPERVRVCDIVSEQMKVKHDEREVVARADAPYYGVQLEERSLVPDDGARRTATKFKDWLYTAVK